jgi:hypothetical protein
VIHLRVGDLVERDGVRGKVVIVAGDLVTVEFPDKRETRAAIAWNRVPLLDDALHEARARALVNQLTTGRSYLSRDR